MGQAEVSTGVGQRSTFLRAVGRWLLDPAKLNQHFLEAATSSKALLRHAALSTAFLAIASTRALGSLIGLSPTLIAVLLTVNLLPIFIHRALRLPAARRAVQIGFVVGVAHLNLLLIAFLIALARKPFTPLWAFYLAHVALLGTVSGLQPYVMGLVVASSLAPGLWLQAVRAPGELSAWPAFALFGIVSAWLYGLTGGLVDHTRDLRRQAEEAERQRALAEQREHISCEIHDGVGAELTASLLLGRTIIPLLDSEGDFPHARLFRGAIEDIQERLQRALADTRQVLWALDPSSCTAQELLARIHRQMGDLCQRTGVEFSSSLNVDEGLPPLQLSSLVKQHVFRVVQEAVSNALRHSRASKVDVQLRADRARLLVIVADNGTGMDASASARGRGLSNMRSRAARMNGRLEVTTSPSGAGVEIRLGVPLDQNTLSS